MRGKLNSKRGKHDKRHHNAHLILLATKVSQGCHKGFTRVLRECYKSVKCYLVHHGNTEYVENSASDNHKHTPQTHAKVSVERHEICVPAPRLSYVISFCARLVVLFCYLSDYVNTEYVENGASDHHKHTQGELS
jgi:hypothetical protein